MSGKSLCRHANTSLSLIKGEANEIEFLRPDYTIQLGLVDYGRRKEEKSGRFTLNNTVVTLGVTPDEYKNNLRLFQILPRAEEQSDCYQ